MLYILQSLFLTQTLLLFEWVARFPGRGSASGTSPTAASSRTLGAYELIRRRVPRIIICDANADPRYELDSVADLMRKARIDFDADLQPIAPAEFAGPGRFPVDVATHLGTLEDLQPKTRATATSSAPRRSMRSLFRVTYHERRRGARCCSTSRRASPATRPSTSSRSTRGIREFPHEGTVDQVFDEAQWESYRGLGEHMAAPLVGRWFWDVPV